MVANNNTILGNILSNKESNQITLDNLVENGIFIGMFQGKGKYRLSTEMTIDIIQEGLK